MSVEENKAVVKRFFEEYNARGYDFKDKTLFDVFEDTYFSEDFVHHSSQGELSREEEVRLLPCTVCDFSRYSLED